MYANFNFTPRNLFFIFLSFLAACLALNAGQVFASATCPALYSSQANTSTLSVSSQTLSIFKPSISQVLSVSPTTNETKQAPPSSGEMFIIPTHQAPSRLLHQPSPPWGGVYIIPTQQALSCLIYQPSSWNSLFLLDGELANIPGRTLSNLEWSLIVLLSIGICLLRLIS
jgi:hypothetical protein